MDKNEIENITNASLKSMGKKLREQQDKGIARDYRDDDILKLNKKIVNLTIILVIETSAILLLTALLLL